MVLESALNFLHFETNFWLFFLSILWISKRIFKDLLRYPLAMEGVYAPGGPVFLAHTKQKVNNIVGLAALRLALFKGYE